MAIPSLPGDINQSKKRHALSDVQPAPAPSTPTQQPAAPVGIGLTRDQIAEQQRARQREAMAARLTQTRSKAGDAIGAVGGLYGDAAKGMVSAATIIPRTAYQVATGEKELNITHLPDYGRHLREDAATKRAGEARQFARQNPGQSLKARQDMDALSARTYAAGMAPPGGPLAGRQAPKPSAAPTPGQPAAQPPVVQPGEPQGRASRTLPDNAQPGEWGNVGYGGIAGRRNAQGIQEFSTAQGDTDAAAGRRFADPNSSVGDGGGLSIVGGGREAMDRNNRAAAIMRQTRLENSNPNYVTTIHDSTASGAQGLINQRKNELEADQRAERRVQHQERIAQGSQQLEATELARLTEQRSQLADELTRQTITQGAMGLTDQKRVQELRELIANPDTPADQRAQAEQAYQALTVSGKDRYMLQDVILGHDAMGGPIVGRVALDTLTGQQVGGAQGQGPAAPRTVTRAEVKARAQRDGVSENEVIEAARLQGIEVRD